MITFSFVVPVYNVEQYLQRCVDSMTRQTYDNAAIEIILVDDGSKDSSGTLCDEYEKKHANIHVYHKENGGLSDARNYGLKYAKNDYVIFLDSDDYVSDETCLRFAEVIKSKGNCDIVTGGVVKHIDGREEIYNMKDMRSGVMTGKDYLMDRLSQNEWYAAAWSNAYRRTFLSEYKLLFLKGFLHEDEDFSPRAFLAADTVACMPFAFYHYVIRSSSITTQKNKKKNAEDVFAICKGLEPLYENVPVLELKRYLKTHSAKICFKAIEDGKLFEKENIHLIDMDLMNSVCCFPKEKLRLIALRIHPKLLHVLNQSIQR